MAAAATLSVRPNPGSTFPRPAPVHLPNPFSSSLYPTRPDRLWRPVILTSSSSSRRAVARAGSRADDSAPFEMSVENALKLLGVSEGASFDDILRAKNSIVANCKDDQEAIAQAEAAYDMLLMRSLTQRRAGKVVDSSIRYADVNPVNTREVGLMPNWLQGTFKKPLVSVETPSTRDLGIQAGVYGALMVLTYVNGMTTSSVAPYAGADVPGLILASSFGASLYFMTRKNIKLGKATVITIGGLVAGAVVGSAVENWLQVITCLSFYLASNNYMSKLFKIPPRENGEKEREDDKAIAGKTTVERGGRGSRKREREESPDNVVLGDFVGLC